MERLTTILIQRMVRKGMEITTIPTYVRDLVNTLAVNGYLSLQELNGRLQSLGWDDFELDDYTLQLIIATFEPDLAYKPPQKKPLQVLQIKHMSLYKSSVWIKNRTQYPNREDIDIRPARGS